MIRIENQCVILFFNFLAKLSNTKQKIIFIELGKEILFGLKEPAPTCIGCKYFCEMSYVEYLRRTFIIWTHKTIRVRSNNVQ